MLMSEFKREWTVKDELLYLETIGLTHLRTAATVDTATMLKNYLIALDKRVAPPELVAKRESFRLKANELLARTSYWQGCNGRPSRFEADAIPPKRGG